MKDKKKNQKSKDLTLVIPAKNEFESLPSVLSELKKYNLKTKVVLEKSDIETIKSIKRFDCQIIYQSGLSLTINGAPYKQKIKIIIIAI